jgi:hypothetical protein
MGRYYQHIHKQVISLKMSSLTIKMILYAIYHYLFFLPVLFLVPVCLFSCSVNVTDLMGNVPAH